MAGHKLGTAWLEERVSGVGRFLPVLWELQNHFIRPTMSSGKGCLGLERFVLVLEKLLYGLIIFLVSSCLERLTHLFFRDGPQPCPDRNASAVRNIHLLSEMCLCEVFFHSPNPAYLYHCLGKGIGSRLGKRPLIRT